MKDVRRSLRGWKLLYSPQENHALQTFTPLRGAHHLFHRFPIQSWYQGLCNISSTNMRNCIGLIPSPPYSSVTLLFSNIKHPFGRSLVLLPLWLIPPGW